MIWTQGTPPPAPLSDISRHEIWLCPELPSYLSHTPFTHPSHTFSCKSILYPLNFYYWCCTLFHSVNVEMLTHPSHPPLTPPSYTPFHAPFSDPPLMLPLRPPSRAPFSRPLLTPLCRFVWREPQCSAAITTNQRRQQRPSLLMGKKICHVLCEARVFLDSFIEQELNIR